MVIRRGWLMAFVVVSVMLLAACSFSPGSPEGRMIYLTVGGSSGSRLIQVEEYEVAGLYLAVNDPQGELLWDEVWQPGEGATTYAIPVKQMGVHEIVVVHQLPEYAEPNSVEERAFFSITGMMISVINITPGAIGMINVEGGIVDDDCCITGAWEGTVLYPSPDYDEFGNFLGLDWMEVLIEMWFDEDGTDEINGYLSEEDQLLGFYLEDMTFIGTWECTAGALSGIWTHRWDHEAGDFVLMRDEEDQPSPIEWESLNLEFSPDCNTMSFDVDFEVGDLVHWELTRMGPGSSTAP